MKNKRSQETTALPNTERRDFCTAVALGGLAAAFGSSSALAASTTVRPTWRRAAALDQVIDAAVASGRIVGTTVIAAQHGEIVYRRAAGFADRETQRPMREDEVFRLASMTKPLVCVTALALADRGQLQLDDAVTRWLPDFRPKLPDGRTPVITLRHLLTHTAGLSYGFLEPEDGPYHRLGVSDGLDNSGLTLAANLQRIAAAPLLFEPGSAWHYSVAIDVLGAVVEHVTGMTLPDAVRRIVTDPLDMSSVRFAVPAGTMLATPYGDASPHPVRMNDPFSLPFGPSAIVYAPSRAFDATAFPSGGVGAVGTAEDYLHFAEAMRTGGAVGTAEDYLHFAEAMRTGGAGVLKPDTLAAMTTNAIGDLPVAAAGPGFGWGLGVAVLRDPVAAKSPANAGTWNWSGVYGTTFTVDPTAELTIVALTNTAVAGMTSDFPTALRRAAYPA